MRRITAVLCVLMLIAAACGKDDAEVATGAAATETPVPAEAPADEPTAVPDPTAAPDPTATPEPEEEPAPSGDIPTGDADSEWCKTAGEVDDELDSLDLGGFTDPAQLEESFQAALKAMKEARGKAPNRIEDAVDTTIEGFETLNDALSDVNYSFLDLDTSVFAALDEKMAEASFVIDEYNFYVCGFDNGFTPGDQPSDFSTFDDSELPEGTLRETVVDEMVASGFTQEEAECILEKLDLSALATVDDPSEILAVFAECGIALDRLGQLGG